MSRLNDPASVAVQYASPDNFDARVRLYRLFAKARPTWLEWLFDEISLQPGETVLEVGTGTGNLWAENAARLPDNGRIVLSDSSPGMLAAARERLAGVSRHFEFESVDVLEIPFEDDSFDVSIANHMLYHVADRERAIRELSRVTAPSGRCCVATNDGTHQIEIRELLARFEVENNMIRAEHEEALFDLETAARELGAHFGSVTLAHRKEQLEVTDAAVIGDYVRSAVVQTPDNLERVAALEQYVASQIDATGAFPITVAAGMCAARK